MISLISPVVLKRVQSCPIHLFQIGFHVKVQPKIAFSISLRNRARLRDVRHKWPVLEVSVRQPGDGMWPEAASCGLR